VIEVKQCRKYLLLIRAFFNGTYCNPTILTFQAAGICGIRAATSNGIAEIDKSPHANFDLIDTWQVPEAMEMVMRGMGSELSVSISGLF
jgi:hypothetical protein